MIRWWTADTHFNSGNIVKYCQRPQLREGDLDNSGQWVTLETSFRRAEQMNGFLYRNINGRVKCGDTVICVGDFTTHGNERGIPSVPVSFKEHLKELNGSWVFVEGNHDRNNGVKVDCDFMTTRIGKTHIGVRHRPLYEDSEQLRLSLPRKVYERELDESEFCRRNFDAVICGHVHLAWRVKRVAGVIHINVGVDVNRYMPLNDSEVIGLINGFKE